MIGSSASVLVEYDRAERWLTEGVRYAEHVELWNHRHYMASHLAHVQWATGQWDAASRTAQHALADGRGGITTWITAQYVLGYLAMGRGDWQTAAGSMLREALAAGEQMAELQRLSPPLWGLAEVAQCRGDYDTTLILCERGYQASADVTDAGGLIAPYLLTGVRAHLARGDVAAAGEWSDRVGAVLTASAIPGTLPAIGHARGLILLARGETFPRHTRRWSRRGSDGGPGASSGRARGPCEISPRLPPKPGAGARRPCSWTRPAPPPRRPVPPLSPMTLTVSPDRSTLAGRWTRGIR